MSISSPSPQAVDVHARYQHSGELSTGEIDGEVVMLSFATESYYYLNGPGSAAWKLLAQPHSLSEICVALCEEYDVDRDTCESQTQDLMQQLLDQGLIQPA
ncbi:MAG: PqqD family protein [Acidobacteria bacterium]|nr:PqqD family protein [Acidobacteriota bacterium]